VDALSCPGALNAKPLKEKQKPAKKGRPFIEKIGRGERI